MVIDAEHKRAYHASHHTSQSFWSNDTTIYQRIVSWNQPQPAFASGKPEHHLFLGEDINVVDTNACDMCSQVAFILVQNEGGRDGALVGIPSCGAKQNKRHVSTRQIIGKSLRTRSTTEKSECNKPRHITSPALSIYI
eukprot:scaffold4978_cov122-Skeletonema_dohrnii-CCMP3373.AAC.2